MARCGRGDGGPPGLSLTSPPWGCPAGFLKEGCELINEALNLFNNVYGAMHVEICACLRLLARLHYIMGDYAEVGLAHRLGCVSRGLGAGERGSCRKWASRPVWVEPLSERLWCCSPGGQWDREALAETRGPRELLVLPGLPPPMSPTQ